MSKKKTNSRASIAKRKVKKHACMGCKPYKMTCGRLKYWFNVINKAAFGGKLVEIPITIRRLRDASGRFIVHTAYGTIKHRCIEMSITLDNKLHFLETLAHEMVHHWQYQMHGTFESLHHGRTFKQWKLWFKGHMNISI